jgi:indole-3-glycerol phosphate synthase
MSTRAATVLERILAQTREEVQRRKRHTPLAERSVAGARAAGDGPARARRFRNALLGERIGVIAEFKRRSPSAGALRENPALAEMLDAYRRGGAVAVSVLTEGPNFGGSLEDLRAARAASDLPLLRKDFVVDPYQLLEARAAGADAVLLIVAALEPAELADLHERARALGLDVLVEAHDRDELRAALGAGADIVGINNRDLRDFSVDVQRTERLVDQVPPDVAVVSESGISGAAQLRRLQARGVHAVLVGESLMRASDPALALRELQSFRDRETAL